MHDYFGGCIVQYSMVLSLVEYSILFVEITH